MRDVLALNILLADATTPLEPSTWVALALAAVATFYVVYRARSKKKSDPLERHAAAPSLAQQRSVERQMSGLLVELSEMSRTISASLDTRAAKLEALIDEADRKIAELRSATNTVATPSDGFSLTPTPPTPTPALAPNPADVAALNVDIPPPSETRLPARSSDEPPTADDPRHVQVYELADLGRSAPEIASMLDRPRGEVELILALRSRAGSASPA